MIPTFNVPNKKTFENILGKGGNAENLILVKCPCQPTWVNDFAVELTLFQTSLISTSLLKTLWEKEKSLNNKQFFPPPPSVFFTLTYKFLPFSSNLKLSGISQTTHVFPYLKDKKFKVILCMQIKPLTSCYNTYFGKLTKTSFFNRAQIRSTKPLFMLL